MSDSQNGLRAKKGKSKKIKFKKSKNFSLDSLKQQVIRHGKHDRREKLDLLRLDELAEFEELLSDYEELAEV